MATGGGGGGAVRRVRESAESVVARARHVFIADDATIEEQARRLSEEGAGGLPSLVWNFDGVHYSDGGPLTAQYLLVLDALNFCFWPDEELEYHHLALGLKHALDNDAHALDAARLSAVTVDDVRRLFRWNKPVPLETERARLLQEVGDELMASFAGEAAKLIKAAQGSATKLVDLVTRHFPGFRDEAVYEGQQVAFYKRAQIFVADVWGAFEGKGLGQFRDIHELTMFADYRVPVVLRDNGILTYSQELADKIDSKIVLPPGVEEIELRAASIVAVERLRKVLEARMKKQLTSVEVDWWLWQQGEVNRKSMSAHHRTLTVFY
eukprot:jgi/Chlat1/6560/Chrsp45S05926